VTVPSRLPAHLEVDALMRRAQADGGFACVLHKGESDAGSLLIVLMEKGTNGRLYERMPQVDGKRTWTCTRSQSVENRDEFDQYLDRRARQDPDVWIIELDIVHGERLIGLNPDKT